MDSATQYLTILIIVGVFVLNAVNIVVRRRGFPLMRKIDALDSFAHTANESIEANRPLHIGLGNITPGTESTMLALVTTEFANYAAQHVTVSDSSPILTVSAAVAIPLATDTLKRAYESRNLLDRYRFDFARWYPSGSQSLAYAAAVTSMQNDDHLGANIFIGDYGAELALMIRASRRHEHTAIAGSTSLVGQAVAYGMANHALIGEEVFAASGYLSGNHSLGVRNVSIDIVRVLIALIIIILTVFSLLNGR